MSGRVRRLRIAAAVAVTGASFAAVATTGAPPAGAVSGPLCSGVTAVAPGQTHAFAFRNEGASKLYGWGNNSKGQLTVSPNTTRTSPVAIDALTGASAISGGSTFTLALFPTGTVKAAGFNSYGQLGNGTTTDSRAPVDTGLVDITAVEAGGYHSLALAADGTVWSWGRNLEGQLGDGTTVNRSTPAPVPGLSGVTDIAAGWHHSLARKADGTVWAWGHNMDGQLGNGTRTNSAIPVQVSGITNAVEVDGGTNFSVALLANQTLRSWGSNTSGQLGMPGGRSTTPQAITSLAGVTKIAAGTFHVLATTADGKTWAWGSNQYGQLGTGAGRVGPPVDSPAANSATPVEVPGASGASAIAANGHSSYAIRAAGTLWAWGNNSSGQLGLGTTTNAYEPRQTGCPSPSQPTPWSLVLVGEPPVARPGAPVVLHAIANQDVGPTPYAIQIYDDATGLLVASCTTGSSCSGPVTSPTVATKSYSAYVASPSATAPPPFVQASAQAPVVWGPVGQGTHSASCDGGTTVVRDDGNPSYLLAFKRPNPDETWVCFRVNDSTAWVGGRIAVMSPAVTPSSVVFDDNAAACSKPDNQAPGPHPLIAGTLGASTPYAIDTYANGTNAYVCMTVADVTKRVAINVTSTPPAIMLSLDGV